MITRIHDGPGPARTASGAARCKVRSKAAKIMGFLNETNVCSAAIQDSSSPLSSEGKTSEPSDSEPMSSKHVAAAMWAVAFHLDKHPVKLLDLCQLKLNSGQEIARPMRGCTQHARDGPGASCMPCEPGSPEIIDLCASSQESVIDLTL